MSRKNNAGVENPARDENRTGPADAQQGFFQWLFMLALSVLTEVIHKSGPKPPISERCQERGKRGNEEQSDQNGTATTVGPLSRCQRLNKESTQNLPLSLQDSDFDERRGTDEVRPAGLPAKWKSGRPDGRAASKQSGIWILKVHAT